MPRRRRRFADLEKQFRESGGVAAPGSRLDGYIKFKKGESKINVQNPLTGAQRRRYGFGILPFGITPPSSPTDANRYTVGITQYSNAVRATLGLTNNVCGYANVTAATQNDDDFYPAVAKIFVSKTGTSTPKSAITGKEYTRQAGNSYSVPFGRTITSVADAKTGVAETVVDSVDEEDVKGSLIVTIKGANANARSISFLPEEFKIKKAKLVSPV